MKVYTSGLSGKQINNLVGSSSESEIQSYVQELQAISKADYGNFKALKIKEYANAIQGLEAKQAALLLSTQGLTNAQIAETLAINESNVAKNYQAMLDAGLLSRKQTLTLAQVQENLQTILGTEARANEAISSLGLSIISKGEEAQTVKLTSKKLQEAVATGVLTKAQEQELLESTLIQLNMDQPQLSN